MAERAFVHGQIENKREHKNKKFRETEKNWVLESPVMTQISMHKL